MRAGLSEAFDSMKPPSPSVQFAIQDQLNDLVKHRVSFALPDSELVAAALLIYFRNINGRHWITRWPEPLESSRTPWWEALPLDWTERERRSWRGASSLASWLGRSSILRVPLAVLRALDSWGTGAFRMRLIFHVPKPEEVLRFQVQGLRPVTLITEKESLWQPVERFPNAFEITIHDLVHAERFQRDPELMLGQVAFFRLLQEVVCSELLNPLLDADPELRREFDYVLSDMNTSPIHGIQYLKAILIRHHLRQRGRSLNEFLGDGERRTFERDFLSLIRVWKLDDAVEESLIRMCSPAYRPEVDGPRIHRMVLSYHQNRADLGSCPER